MAFCWLLALLNNCISTNIYGPFESFFVFQNLWVILGVLNLFLTIGTPASMAPSPPVARGASDDTVFVFPLSSVFCTVASLA
jgi:hypothetical protein